VPAPGINPGFAGKYSVSRPNLPESLSSVQERKNADESVGCHGRRGSVAGLQQTVTALVGCLGKMA
jgi:hypothetical protein